jgi:16S rRNA processing protein RimM
MSPLPIRTFEGYFLLGKIIRTHGYKGGLKAVLDVDEPQEYRELDMIFVDMKGQLVPWMVDDIHLERNKANIKLKELNTMEAAEKLVHHAMYLPVELLPKLRGNKFYYHEVIGFKVHDANKGDIGVIDRVIELPNNPLLAVKLQDKEILLPISDDIIVKVDRRKKQIDVVAPEGLIDIYLQ